MMEAGRYYVGDLCYVLHDEWDDLCDITIDGNHICDGEFELSSGKKFAIYTTAYGGGGYEDRQGRMYDVDSGGIGCIKLSDIDLNNEENFLLGGQIINFPNPFKTSRTEKGTIRIGHISIKT